MTNYIILSNGKEKASYSNLKKANLVAKTLAMRTGTGHEVLRSLHVFEGESGKKLK